MTSLPEVSPGLPEAARYALWPLPELGYQRQPPESVRVPAATPEEAAYQRGLEEGHRAAGLDAERQHRASGTVLAAAVAALEAARREMADCFESNLNALAVGVARHLVQREVTVDPTIVRDLVRRAIDMAPMDGSLEARLHPADLAALQDQLELFTPTGQPLAVQWIADATLDRGAVVVETAQRIVDGRIDRALLAVYERLAYE